jgi:hypothetical protein
MVAITIVYYSEWCLYTYCNLREGEPLFFEKNRNMHEYALPGWLVNLLGVVITTPFVGVYDNPYEREGIFNHLV